MWTEKFAAQQIPVQYLFSLPLSISLTLSSSPFLRVYTTSLISKQLNDRNNVEYKTINRNEVKKEDEIKQQQRLPNASATNEKIKTKEKHNNSGTIPAVFFFLLS